jgi:hypothetical protein
MNIEITDADRAAADTIRRHIKACGIDEHWLTDELAGVIAYNMAPERKARIENHIACSGCGSPVVVRDAIGAGRICAECAGKRLVAADALVKSCTCSVVHYPSCASENLDVPGPCDCGIDAVDNALDAYRAACKPEKSNVEQSARI